MKNIENWAPLPDASPFGKGGMQGGERLALGPCTASRPWGSRKPVASRQRPQGSLNRQAKPQAQSPAIGRVEAREAKGQALVAAEVEPSASEPSKPSTSAHDDASLRDAKNSGQEKHREGMPPLQQSMFKHISKNLDVDGVTKELDKKNKILSTRLSKKVI